MWNKKKENFLLILEFIISFFVLFAVFSLMVYSLKNYNKGVGFEPDLVWAVELPQIEGNGDSVEHLRKDLEQTLRLMPQMSSVSFSDFNIPYYLGTRMSQLNYNGRAVDVEVFSGEDSYEKVLGLQMDRGRWFAPADAAANTKKVVINQSLAEVLFGSGDPIGKQLTFNNSPRFHDDSKMEIIGVVHDFKSNGDYRPAGNNIYMPFTNYQGMAAILMRVSPGAGIAFEGSVNKTLQNYFNNQHMEIVHLSDKRISKNKFSLIPMIILFVIAGFLIANVALGLTGLLWYNIQKRKAEFGLRRALGARKNSLSWQLVLESIVLVSLAVFVGLFFGIQFPLLNLFDLSKSIYISALAMATLSLYILVIACSFYPGRQAAKIMPAVVLHED